MMKRLIYIILFVALYSVKVHAQNCDQATFYTEPANFTAEDQVTVFADLSACSYLSALDEVYIWIFVPDGPGPDGVGGNGDFCNGSNPNLLMTNEGNNIWSYTFVPTQLFDATPAEIGDQIGFIPKEFAGCKGNGDQTENLFLTVDPSIFIPTEARNFPARFSQDDFVTIYFDQNLTANGDMAALDDIYVYTWVSGMDAVGNPIGNIEKQPWVEVANTPELQTTNEGNGIFSLTMDMRTFFPIEEGTKVSTISYIFRNAEGTIQSDTFSSELTEFDNE